MPDSLSTHSNHLDVAVVQPFIHWYTNYVMWTSPLLQATQVPSLWKAKQGTEQACLEEQQESAIIAWYYLGRVSMLECLWEA